MLDEKAAPVAKRRVAAAPFWWATGNLAKENRSKRNVNLSIHRLMQYNDVIAFQEVETPLLRAMLSANARSMGFGVFWPHRAYISPTNRHRWGSSAAAVPMAYRLSRFTMGDLWETVRLVDGQKYNFPTEYAPWITLRDKLAPLNEHGKHCRLYTWNTHMVPQAFTSKPYNRPEWEYSMRKLEAMADRFNNVSSQPIVGGGDMNKSKATIQGFAMHHDAPTHGSEYYDLGYTSHAGVLDTAWMDLPGSDHNSLRLKIVPQYYAPRKNVSLAPAA